MLNDKWEFEQIYKEFQPQIYHYLTRLVGTRGAEDLTQDTFIKINQGLPAFRSESQLSTWIYKIATNAAIDRMRSNSYKQGATESYSLEVDLNEKDIPSEKRPHSTEEQVIRWEMNECIQGYISVLPENYWTVVVLSEMEGMKNAEIAEILGLSISTVKIRLHRAKERLKELLLANCNFYQTECCGRLACEPKGSFPKSIKPFNTKK
jgi:RNA polymerase sigma-70 factor (ECF subfamily)